MSTEDDKIGVNRRGPSVTDGTETQTLSDGPDDGSEEVQISEPGAEETGEDFNLVQFYSATDEGKKFLTEVSDIVQGSFKTMWESTEEYREKRAQLYRLFRGNLEPKSEPFEDCANIHLPVVLQAIAMLVPRLVTELFPSDDYIFKALPTGPEDQERADIVTTHGDWQFKHEQPDFIPQFERATTETLLAGSAFFYSCRDRGNNRNRHEFLSCEQFVMSYTHVTTDPSLSDVPEKIMIRRWRKHELEQLVADGYYDADVVAEIMEPTDDPKIRGNRNRADEPELTVKDAVDEVEGHHRPEDDPSAPWVFYEYHGWLQLPGGDRQRPVVAVMDTDQHKIVSFYVREEDDWRDRERYERQTEALEQYQQMQQMFLAEANDPARAQAVAMGMAAPPQPPQPPPDLQMDEAGSPVPPAPPKKVPIEYFTRIDCIYDPHGSMGIGIGDLVRGFNEVANQLGNLFIDAASLANSPPQLVSENALPPGDVEVGPGQIIRSPLPPEQLEKAHKVLVQAQANPQLLEMMNLMVQVAKEVAATPDVYAGEPGKANETYRGIATRVQEATKPLTAIAQRLLRGLTEIVKKNARLNANFLPDEELVSVIDPLKGRQKLPITRSMYLEDYDITFTADTRFVSTQQKVDEDMSLMMFAQQSPLLVQQPFQQAVFLYEVATRYLKDMRRPELIPFLGPRPVPPPPPQPVPPHEENAGFLQGKQIDVNPQDDDRLHVADHQAFLGSPEGGYLDTQQKQNLEQHVRNHIASGIMKAAKGVTTNGVVPGGPGGGGGAPGMAPQSSNPAGAAPPQGGPPQ